ncbi:hypothetical protein [Roseomonas sp. BN140053]|uniref:hypothetical protein n=1 Tax=Roseomonas sp. BN140053 TaxID=3391898 RepID=UPI0039E85595
MNPDALRDRERQLRGRKHIAGAVLLALGTAVLVSAFAAEFDVRETIHGFLLLVGGLSVLALAGWLWHEQGAIRREEHALDSAASARALTAATRSWDAD